MSGIRAVAFDLDGTLIDSRHDLAAAVNGLRGELGLAALPLGEVVAKVGRGARNLVRRTLPPEIAGEDFERAFRRFGERYFDVCLDETALYPGIRELLECLDEAGLPLGVVTNKPERPTRKILQGLGLDAHFRVILGGDSLPVRKPDPEPLFEAARRLAAAPAATALVGDSSIDAETARAAGSPFVLVDWGFGIAAELTEYSPWRQAGTPAEVAVAILASREI